MVDSGRITLTLYSRNWCHLCDDMLAGLRTLQVRQPFELSVVDIDSQPALASELDKQRRESHDGDPAGQRQPRLPTTQRLTCQMRGD